MHLCILIKKANKLFRTNELLIDRSNLLFYKQLQVLSRDLYYRYHVAVSNMPENKSTLKFMRTETSRRLQFVDLTLLQCTL